MRVLRGGLKRTIKQNAYLEKITKMTAIADRLNNRIDLMQAERSPFAHGSSSVDAEEIAMLQMVAGLKSLLSGTVGPDAGFAAQLRTRMLAATALGTEIAEN